MRRWVRTSRSVTGPRGRSRPCPGWARRSGCGRGRGARGGRGAERVVFVGPRGPGRRRPHLAHHRARPSIRPRRRGGLRPRARPGTRVPHGEPAHLASLVAARDRASTRVWPSSGAGGTAPRSTWARTPRSGWSRCTSRRSCWTRGRRSPGEPLAVEFWDRLRDEIRYDSVEELVEAIAVDVERTRLIDSESERT